MSTTSTKFQFKLPDGTDVMDNDQFIKGNFQKIEDNVLKKSETIETTDKSNVRMEVIESGVSTDGTKNTVTMTATFSKPFTSPPTVSPANITSNVSYGDTIRYPYVHTITNTQFSVTYGTANPTDLLGAGVFTVKFIVIGN